MRVRALGVLGFGWWLLLLRILRVRGGVYRVVRGLHRACIGII